MKYVFRRLLAGLIIVPVVGFGYLLLCGVLIALGASQGYSASAYLDFGLVLGVALTLWFALDGYGKGK